MYILCIFYHPFYSISIFYFYLFYFFQTILTNTKSSSYRIIKITMKSLQRIKSLNEKYILYSLYYALKISYSLLALSNISTSLVTKYLFVVLKLLCPAWFATCTNEYPAWCNALVQNNALSMWGCKFEILQNLLYFFNTRLQKFLFPSSVVLIFFTLQINMDF